MAMIWGAFFNPVLCSENMQEVLLRTSPDSSIRLPALPLFFSSASLGNPSGAYEQQSVRPGSDRGILAIYSASLQQPKRTQKRATRPADRHKPPNRYPEPPRSSRTTHNSLPLSARSDRLLLIAGPPNPKPDARIVSLIAAFLQACRFSSFNQPPRDRQKQSDPDFATPLFFYLVNWGVWVV